MTAPDPNTPVRVVHSFLDGLPPEKHIPDTKPGDITYTTKTPCKAGTVGIGLARIFGATLMLYLIAFLLFFLFA